MELTLVEMTPPPDGEHSPAADSSTSAVPATGVAPPSPVEEIDLVAFNARRAAPIRLELETAPSPFPGPAKATATAPAVKPADPFMAEALREHQAGTVDLPLWSRAISQHAGEEAQVVAAYLQARATVLRIEHRQRRSCDPQPPIPAAIPVKSPLTADDDDNLVDKSALRERAWRKYAVMATPILVVAVAAVWWMVSTQGPESAPTSNAVAASGVPPTPPTAAPRPARISKEEDPSIYFSGKVQELKSAGNWNVLVLFASEWTRKQPDNATAWKELSLGYSNMRQYNDALEAGTKATELAPSDPLVWHNLAQVNIELKQPERALKAYERAAALNDLDLYSLLQVGALNVALDQLPQARAAFERVLAADPENPDALCGTASIAQRQGRGKDAEAITKQLRGTDRKCREIPSVVNVATGK